MSKTSYTGFFGDAEHTFKLTPAMILELERVTGAGIGGIFRRLSDGSFGHADLIHTIRLGLIGGGTSPEQAKALVDTYALGRPILETFPLALSILEALWRGSDDQSVLTDEAAA